jgi:hypothetical protein
MTPRHAVLLATTFLFSITSYAQDPCASVRMLTPGLEVPGPADATHIVVTNDRVPPTVILIVQTPGGRWQVTQPQITALGNDAALKNLGTRKEFHLQFLNAADARVGGSIPFLLTENDRGIVCPGTPSVPTPPSQTTTTPPPTAPTASARSACDQFTDVISACNCIGPEQIKVMDQERKVTGEPGFTALFFTLSGQLCYWNRQFGVQGDPINAVFINDGSLSAPTAQFAPCSPEPEGIAAYVPGAFPTLPQAQSGKPFTPFRVLAQRCFNSSVDITVSGRKLDENNNPASFTGKHTLTQYARYRTTLQVGTAFTDLHDNTYGLRPDGTQMRIFNKGPVNKGPEYFASVVIYAFPRYFGELFSRDRHYLGRDIVNDQALLDRIGGLLGASASNPGRRFLLGLSFEVVRGVNVVGTREFARVQRLVGFNEGDVFSGAENTIPVRDQWERDYTLGISLDFRYVNLLFSRQ